MEKLNFKIYLAIMIITVVIDKVVMQMKKLKEKVVSTRLKEEDIEWLKKLADMKGITVSNLVRNILLNYMKEVD